MFCQNCGAKIPDNSIFCDNCGSRVAEASFSAGVSETAASDVEAEKTRSISDTFDASKPERALWAALLLFGGWLILAVVQALCVFTLRYSPTAFTCLSAGVIGTGVYLISRRGINWKIFGVALGLFATLMLMASEMLQMQVSALRPGLAFLGRMFGGRFRFMLRSYLWPVLACLGTALIISLLRMRSLKSGAVLEGLFGGIAYLVPGAVRAVPAISYKIQAYAAEGRPAVGKYAMIMIRQNFNQPISGAITIFLVCIAVAALCNMQRKETKLYGIGRVWAWIALIGAGITALGVIVYAAVTPKGALYSGLFSYYLVLGLAGFIGYLLLLRGRRIGLYFILIGTGLMILVEILDPLFRIISNMQPTQALAGLAGALNPLFAWLAVRAGDKNTEV